MLKKKISDILAHYEWIKPLLVLIVMFLLFIQFSPESKKGAIIFLKSDNLIAILRQVSEIGIIAIGMTLVILTGGIDLSVGSILAVAATFTAFGLMDWQLGFWLTIALSFIIGAVAGAINGAITSWGRIQSFVTTLSMMVFARGFALFISDNNSRDLGYPDTSNLLEVINSNAVIAAPASFKLFSTPFLGIPFPVYVFVAVSLLFTIVLTRMKIGRYIYVIGSNEEAAKLAGIPVNWIRTFAFTCAGALSALAGTIHCAQLEQGNPNDGVGFELDAIAAVVIGGTSLMGGKGTIAGTFAGVLIIGILNNFLGLHGVEKSHKLMLQGAIIVTAVLLQERKWKYN